MCEEKNEVSVSGNHLLSPDLQGPSVSPNLGLSLPSYKMGKYSHSRPWKSRQGEWRDGGFQKEGAGIAVFRGKVRRNWCRKESGGECG